MKVKGFIVTGLVLSILGVGITAVASTQIDFKEDFDGVFSDPNLEQKEQSFGKITKIVYDGTDENLDIIYSEGENIFTYYESESLTYEIEYNEELEELHITQDHTFSFFNFSFINKKGVLKVNSSLDEITILASAGNIGLKDLTVNQAKVEVKAGNLKLENTEFGSLIVKSDAGNVNGTNMIAETANLEVKAGNLKIVDSKLLNSMILTNAGNVNITSTTIDQLDAKLNAGNFTLNGDILTRGEFRLDAGNLKLTLARSKEDYTVNGENAGATIILYKVSAGNKNIYYQE